MDDQERNLKRAVLTAKSNFYAFKGKKRKQTRKEARKEARASKKHKRNSKRPRELIEQRDALPVESQLPTKKKRKRKKKNNPMAGDDSISYERSAYEAANKIDEQIISSLGKKLGMNRKNDKLSSKFKQDGLDYILEVCESFTGENGKGYSSDEEYLLSKSRKSKKTRQEPQQTQLSSKTIKDKLLFEDGNGSDLNEELANDDGEDDPNFLLINDDNAAAAADDDDHGDDDDDDDDDGGENEDDNFRDNVDEDDLPDDSIGDIEAESDVVEDEDDNENEEKDVGDEETIRNTKATKYIPPALRNKASTETDKRQLEEIRLKKKLKGLLNRLSDGTMVSIVSEIHNMYLSNSRNFTNEVLCSLISESCVSTIPTPEKLVLQHMVIVAALHMVIGSEVGGYFLQTLTERFAKLHNESPSYGEGKTSHNVLRMLVSLYQLKVVDSLLIYDLIRSCMTKFQEQDIEFIFLILKCCGPDLRRDDPGALKEIIVDVHTKSSQYQNEEKSYVNFMLDTINALKNNNTRKIPLYDETVVEEARKSLKTVVHGKCKNVSNMKLKVSLEDMLNVEEKGRWWITGSAWSGRGPLTTTQSETPEVVSEEENNFSSKVLKAAKKQRMNTTIRKQIFCVIVSSEDYMDAFEKLLKLNFTEKQFREVVHVLLDCCLQEKTYNPFYAHLANRLCEFNRSNQVTFQYSFWDRFKTINNLKMHNLNNLQQLLANLIAAKSLSLSALKIVSFGALDQDSIRFFKTFFSTFILQYPSNAVKMAFQRIASLPKLSLLREGIKLFLRQHVLGEKSGEDALISNNRKLKEMMEVVEAAIDGTEYVPL